MLERQLLVIVAVLLVAPAATGLIGGPLAALIGFALARLLFAPVLIEASSWINTAVDFGAAVGALVVGALTGATGPDIALAWTGM